ncbi:hypothetical protein [Rosenbergiella metrosideri]|uniref:hypothetical protein n=1 Tax=Rosenbergiella metrosideri TaxID=2921185 RepID=UPI001F4F43D4|nr:hypothetical protein [Rosenbergiella metrosideri]
MAKPDWSELQSRFLSEHAESGVSPREWCESQGLNYATARRYIKNPIAQKTAQVRNKRKNKTAQVRKSKPPPTNGLTPGHRRSVIHSGYAKYMPDSDELFADAQGLDLMQELIFVRARTLSATKVLGKLRNDFESAQDAEGRVEIAKQISGAEQAIDRNLARVESLERTISGLGLDRENLAKIIADTAFRVAATDKTGLEADKLRKEVSADKADHPITRMEVVIVGENNQNDPNTSTG